MLPYGMRPTNPAKLPEKNLQVVEKASHLPAAVANVITLDGGTIWEVHGNVTPAVGDSIELGPAAVLRGRAFAQAGIDCLSFDTTAPAITASVGACYIDNLNVAQAGSGEGVELDFNAFHWIRGSEVTGGVRHKQGNLNLLETGLMDKCYILDSTLAGSGNAVTIRNCQMRPVSGEAGIDFEAGAALLAMNCFFTGFQTVTGSFGIRADSAGQVLAQAQVQDGIFLGTGTSLSGLSPADATWAFKRNIGVADSADQGVASFTSAGTTIALNAAGDWFDVAGTGITWVEQAGAEKFLLTDTANGTVTHFNGLQIHSELLDSSFTFTRSGGANVDIQFGVSINGAAPIVVASEEATNKSQTFSTSLQVAGLSTGDTLRLRVRCADGSGNDIVTTAGALTVVGL